MSQSEPDPHFLQHPEVKAIFDSISDLLNESDRGTVLVCATHVDVHLERLYQKVAPSGVLQHKRRSLLTYPGPLSTLSARTDVAVLVGLISVRLGNAINCLRRLRNNVAHSSASFRLRDHWNDVRGAYNLGPELPAAINRMALRVLLDNAVTRFLKIRDPLDENRLYFETPGQVLDYLHEHPDILQPLEERAPRLELALGTAMICGMIVLHREDHGRKKNAR